MLREDLVSFLADSDISPSVMGQYIKVDEETAKFTADNGISPGKAALISELANSGNARMTKESLLKLSTQELILLGQSKSISKENTVGKADTSRYIGRDSAINKALEMAGISKSDAGRIEAEFDCDDGMIIYEVEFTANGSEYEIEVDAKTGKIVSAEKESLSTGRKASVKRLDADDDDDDDDD